MSSERIGLGRIALAGLLLQLGAAPAGPNLTLIGAPLAWALGASGRGVVVAVLDTGADLSHPELAARWRGGGNSWFDPYGQHPDRPVDLDGHGTQVLGVIVGGQGEGRQIGLAPEAQWIAARVFDDQGRATPAAIHAVFRWVLDPDGDPQTDDAPDVVNASWSSDRLDCAGEFAPDLQALRAAGILPVFAGGTQAPLSPANLPGAFAVGALDGAATLLADSPVGPSPCAPADAVFPQLVAPGAGIITTDSYGAYATAAGTSLAAAHVSGALALVLSVRSGLTAGSQADLLRSTAVDLGQPGPDNAFGFGRLNVGWAVAQARLAGIGPGEWWLLSISLGLAGWLIVRARRDR